MASCIDCGSAICDQYVRCPPCGQEWIKADEIKFDQRDREMASIPTMARNSLIRNATRAGVDMFDVDGTARYAQSQGRAGLMALRNLGTRGTDAILAWADGRASA